MVHIDFEGAKRYFPLNERFEKAFEALNKVSKEPFVKGRHEVDGDEIFINALEYDTAPESEKVFEAHREYIDVMYLLDGEEDIGYTPLKNLKCVTKEYTSDGDYLLGSLTEDTMWVHMQPGDVCILFPEDAHAPGKIHGEVKKIHKLIAKVRV